MVTALLNWGLGLIVGAIVAREVGRSCARRGVEAHYPLIAAAGYAGLLCWHGGLSGSAPLMMTTTKNVAKFLGPELAASVGTLPMSATVLAPRNLIATGGLLLIVPLLAASLAPRAGEPMQPYSADAHQQDLSTSNPAEGNGTQLGWAQRAEHSRMVAAAAIVPLAAATLLWLRDTGLARLEPNALNLIFLTVGLAMHGSLHRYSRAVGDALRGVTGIVLQFPFYAGIMGVMRTTGLASSMAGAMAAAAPAKALGVVTMISAGIINLFVPSGGGQWAVQGPIALEAAQRLGVSPSSTVMAVAYGDQLTNMLQPFWALPLLAITGVAARDIIGYTAVWMLAAGAWLAGCLWLLG
jgi:short-chain fatty acids transporter